jgi:hypothetical protein
MLLHKLSTYAFAENTGARGLVSAVEKALLEYERKLPSSDIKKFPATANILEKPQVSIKVLTAPDQKQKTLELFKRLQQQEKESIREYLKRNKANLAAKYSLTLTQSRIELVAACYVNSTMDIGNVIKKIKSYYDEIKKIELYFFKNHDINIVLEEDAIDFIIEQLVESFVEINIIDEKINQDFQHGLKLAREKTGRNRFFITRQALLDPEVYIGNLIKDNLEQT